MPKSIFVDPDKMRAEGKITFKDIPINVYKKSVQEELDEGNYTKEDLIRIFRDMTICREFEDMLNQIMPGMIPLAVVFFAYKLLGTKKVNSTGLIFILIGMGMILGNLQNMIGAIVDLF